MCVVPFGLLSKIYSAADPNGHQADRQRQKDSLLGFRLPLDGFDNSIARGIVPHFYFDDVPGTPFVIGILHSDSEQFPGTRKCCFLTESRPSGNSCGVHPAESTIHGLWSARRFHFNWMNRTTSMLRQA